MRKYLWYSGATDITGKTLAEALELTGSKTKPRTLRSGDIVVAWGAKTSDPVTFPNGVKVLNHPDKIKANRNKLEALKSMKGNNDLVNTIAPFCTAGDVGSALNNGTVALPLIGRTKYHQGGKGFWLCPTKSLVDRAIADGAQYFQNFIDIKNEYRLHVAFGNLIYAVKKVENTSEASWTAQRKEKIKDYAQKNNVTINNNTLDYALKILFKEAVLPDAIVRSNRRGWKFSNVRLNNVNAGLKAAAIKAVEALGLDFGAVDCAMGNDNNPYIIEVNTGPGLQGTAQEKYIEAFRAKITELETPAPAAAAPAASQRAARPARTNAPAAAAVGVGAQNAPVVDGGLAVLMQNVQNDEEARAVIEALVAQRNQQNQ